MTGRGRVLVGLGSNVATGETLPAEIVAAAMEELGSLGSGARASRLWRSPAWPPGGPEYVNSAMGLDVSLGPEVVLEQLHRIEAQWGRERRRRWDSRTLDLDLLAWGDEVRPNAATQRMWRDLPADRQSEVAPDSLILPHPRMQDRGFVLLPLAEVAPDWRHPSIGRTVAEMLGALPAAALEGIVPLEPR